MEAMQHPDLVLRRLNCSGLASPRHILNPLVLLFSNKEIPYPLARSLAVSSLLAPNIPRSSEAVVSLRQSVMTTMPKSKETNDETEQRISRGVDEITCFPRV